MSSGAGTAAVLARFDVWYARHLADAAHDELSRAEMRSLLDTLFARSRGAIRIPEASALEALLTEVDGDPVLAPRMPDIVVALEHYLDFAIETGVWDPSDATLERSEDILAAAYELSAGLLGFLLGSLDDVEDPAAAEEIAAIAAIAPLAGSGEALSSYLSELIGSRSGDPKAYETPLVVHRVLGVLAVAAAPERLPGFSTAEIIRRLDAAFGESSPPAAVGEATSGILAQLENDGVIAVRAGDDGDRYEAPVGIRGLLADALLDIGEALGLVDDGSLNLHAAGTALQLKVALVGTKPAVWRRLLVDAGATFAELHLAIQLTLEFTDEAEYRFTVTEEGDEVILTSADVVVSLGSGAVDADQVEIGELFVGVGDEVDYRYDLVAGWRAVVRLEKLLEGTGEALPRCVGGAGRGPSEDSGGPSGWAAAVAEEGLDASAFDLAAADDMLTALRLR